jgi:hypothetical protein
MRQVVLIAFVAFVLSLINVVNAQAEIEMSQLKGIFPIACRNTDISGLQKSKNQKISTIGYLSIQNDELVVYTYTYAGADCRGEKINIFTLTYQVKLGDYIDTEQSVRKVDFEIKQVHLMPATFGEAAAYNRIAKMIPPLYCGKQNWTKDDTGDITCQKETFGNRYNIVKVLELGRLQFGEATADPVKRTSTLVDRIEASIE